VIALRAEALADSPANALEVECFRGRIYVNGEMGPVVSIRAQDGPLLAAIDELPGSRSEVALQLLLPELISMAESGTLLAADNGQGIIPFNASTDQLARLPELKRCSYQRGDAPSLLCNAAPAGTKVTPSDCHQCDVPAENLLCRWCAHVEIQTFEAPGARFWSPSAQCGRPKPPESVAQRDLPDECRPAGNDCWEIVLADPTAIGTRRETSGRAMLELLDHLDTVWRLQTGQGRLFRPGSLAQVATVVDPVVSFMEYRGAVNDLVQLINRAVPAGGASGRHLAHMEELVGEYSPSAASAVATLRSVVNFRAKLEHSPREQSVAAGEAGIRFGTVSWAESWQSVLNVTADAVRVLVGAIKAHVDSSSAVTQ